MSSVDSLMEDESAKSLPQQADQTDLLSWSLRHDRRRNRARYTSDIVKLILLFISAALICCLWFGAAIQDAWDEQLRFVVWQLNTDDFHRGNQRLEQTVDGWVRTLNGVPYEHFVSKRPRNIDPLTTPHAKAAVVLAVGLCGIVLFLMRRREKRYIRFDDAGILLSEDDVVGKGEAEFIEWEKLTAVEMQGTEIGFRLDNGRKTTINWSQAKKTLDPITFANAIETHAPKAAMACPKLHSIKLMAEELRAVPESAEQDAGEQNRRD
jgi:hypothetical protein